MFTLAVIPARYALEWRIWAERVPYTEAMTYVARALGAARVRRPS